LRIKTGIYGLGMGIRELDFTGFSGHTALSSFLANSLVATVRTSNICLRFASVIVGYALAGLVGYSR
jgi:hypothetical protein